MNKTLLNAIVANGEEYCRRYLSKYDAGKLEKSWWEAFDFFLARACFQGRKDEMSLRVYDNARDVLSQLFSDDQAEDNFSRNAAEHWQAVAGKLRDKIGKGKVGKSRDVDMVVSALSYINKIPYKNIVAHSATQIRGGKLKQHYQELQSRSGDNGITQVGPKIAAFYLRDVVSLCQLSGSVDNASAFCLQAVDTWVQKVAEKLGIVRVGADTSEVQNAIVGLCEKEQISALRFNQGAWFTGYHSFDLVLDLLSK